MEFDRVASWTDVLNRFFCRYLDDRMIIYDSTVKVEKINLRPDQVIADSFHINIYVLATT